MDDNRRDDNRRLVLAERPTGKVDENTIALHHSPIPQPGPGEALAQIRFLSIDPAIRMWMNEESMDMPPIPVGDIVRGAGIAEIIHSNSEQYRPGDLVFGLPGWQDYVIVDEAQQAMRVLPAGVSPTDVLGALGINGLTAYVGMIDVGGVHDGDVVVVSAAAGATGSIAGQIARANGAATVIGIASGAEKCSWLVDELGFDVAIDRATTNVADALRAAAPNGIDLYFDNVGGDILDACLAQLATNGRVVLCGAISGYNAQQATAGPANYQMLIFRAGTMQGFNVYSKLDRLPAAQADIAKWMAEGQIKASVHIVDGLERAPEALDVLFTGANKGKVIVRV